VDLVLVAAPERDMAHMIGSSSRFPVWRLDGYVAERIGATVGCGRSRTGRVGDRAPVGCGRSRTVGCGRSRTVAWAITPGRVDAVLDRSLVA
jgi:hypothetical protein